MHSCKEPQRDLFVFICSESEETCDLGEWFVNAKEAGVFVDLTKEQIKMKKHIVGLLKRKQRKVDCHNIVRYNTVFNIPEDDASEADGDDEGLFEDLTQESDAVVSNGESEEQVDTSNENTSDDEDEYDDTGDVDSEDDRGSTNADEDEYDDTGEGEREDDRGNTNADELDNIPTGDGHENEESSESNPNDDLLQEAGDTNESINTAPGDDEKLDDDLELNDVESEDSETDDSMANIDDTDNQSGEEQNEQNDDEDFVDDAAPENDGGNEVGEADHIQSEEGTSNKNVKFDAAGPDESDDHEADNDVLENDAEDELSDAKIKGNDNGDDDNEGEDTLGGMSLDDDGSGDNDEEDTLGDMLLENRNDAAQVVDISNDIHMDDPASSDEESNINEELLADAKSNDELQDDDSGDDIRGIDDAEDAANDESLLSSIWNSLSGGNDIEDQPSEDGEDDELVDEMDESNDDGEPSAEASSDDDEAVNDMGDGVRVNQDSTGERIIKVENDTDIILIALNGVCRKSSCNNMDSLSVIFNDAINTYNRKRDDAKEIGKSAIKNEEKLLKVDDNFLKSHVADTKKATSKETLEQLEVDIQRMIDDKTSKYEIKVQSLEILIVRLENQVLLDKLDKQNHTSTFSRLENQILRLENELLRINQTYSELKYDNENMRAGQIKYLELEHQADQKEQAEASKSHNEVITQQEARLGELTHQLSVQSDHVDTLRDQSADLAEQNKILSDTVSSQSDMITHIMNKIQHLESFKHGVNEQENTMDIHMGKENAMHQIHSMISDAATDGATRPTAGRSALMRMYMLPMFDYITINENITCCCIAKSIYLSLMSFTCVPIDVYRLDEKGFIKLQHRDSTQSDTKTKNAGKAKKTETHKKKKTLKKSDSKKSKPAPKKVVQKKKTKAAPAKAEHERNSKKTEAKRKSTNTEDNKGKSDKKSKIKDTTKTNKSGDKKITNSTESIKTKNTTAKHTKTDKDQGEKTKSGIKSNKETQAGAKDAKTKVQTKQTKSNKTKPAAKAKDEDTDDSASKSDTNKKTKTKSKEKNDHKKGESPASEKKNAAAATKDEHKEADSRPAPLYAAENNEPKGNHSF